MSSLPVIAVFDVGKTNKKLFLFDEQYSIVYEQSHQFEETRDDDGDPCENLEKLTSWGRRSFNDLSQLQDFDIRAINFTAYGASFVHVDEAGIPILPLFNYLKPYPEDLKTAFFAKYGGEEAMAMETASPVLDSLNSGLQLYRLQREGKFEGKKSFSLHLPQYMSFLISGKMYSDITSIGCHTMLWHFRSSSYHPWVHEEKIAHRLPPVFPSDGVLPSRAHSRDFNVGAGLHDSSAALIPYLSSFHQPFILISTGTWCISLNPFNETPLTPEQLRQDCLAFLSYLGRPVKASRLFAGYEHEEQIKRLSAKFQKHPSFFETVQFNRRFVEVLQRRNDDKEGLGRFPGPSVFRLRDLGGFNNYEEAYHRLIMDIMRQQVMSTRLVMEGQPVKRIFVDGGFGRNSVYMNLLADGFPGVEVFAATVPQATAMGAGLAVHAHWNQQDLPSDLIALKYYSGNSPAQPQ